MTKAWLIDGKAFDIANWRSFVHDSLRDMRVFYSDLNAHLNDDGTTTVTGMTKNSAGKYERNKTVTVFADEHDPLYATNRGAAVGETLGADGFDRFVLEAFMMPVQHRLDQFDALYTLAVRGDADAVFRSWAMIPDTAKLVYTLHLWERTLERRLDPAMWAVALQWSWPHGKIGSMLFRANLSEAEVIEMFRVAPRNCLMPAEDREAAKSFPAEVIAWRGASSFSRFLERGFSWTTDRNQAEWFAHTNAYSGEPRLLEARVRKNSILMYSSFEHELVLNPVLPPLSVTHHALTKSGGEERRDELRTVLRRQDKEEMAPVQKVRHIAKSPQQYWIASKETTVEMRSS